MYRMMTAQWKSLRGVLIMPRRAPFHSTRGMMKSSGVKPMAPHCGRWEGGRVLMRRQRQEPMQPTDGSLILMARSQQ